MPTGYTSKIYNGEDISGKEFILTCSRAFGALIEMRDESLETPIPEKFESDNHYIKNLKQAEQKLEEAKNIPLEEAEKKASEQYHNHLLECQRVLKDKLELKKRYEKTLKEVKNWEPPTSEHTNLKTFCIKQLEESISFDCATLDYYNPDKVERLSGEQWKTERIAMYERDVLYYKKAVEEENNRIHERNEWIRQLRESLTLANDHTKV